MEHHFVGNSHAIAYFDALRFGRVAPGSNSFSSFLAPGDVMHIQRTGAEFVPATDDVAEQVWTFNDKPKQFRQGDFGSTPV